MAVPFSLRFALVGIFLAAFQLSAQYTVNMPYQDIAVENASGTAIFKGGFSISMPGQPAVPSYNVTFLLPPEADVNGVSVTIVNPAEKELSGRYDVRPCEVLPSTPAGKYPSVIDGKDTMVYRTNAFFPAEYNGKASCGSMRQYKIVTVPVNAYRYNPVTKKLRTISGGTLQVTFAKGGSTPANSVRDARTEQLLGVRVVNPSVFNTYGALPQQGAALNRNMQSMAGAVPGLGTTKPSTIPAALAGLNLSAAQPLSAAASSVNGHAYLVLTTDYIANNSSALNYFLYYTVTQQGGQPYVNTVESILPPGIDGQARADCLRDWIRYAKASIDLTNFLIIGSPDVDNGDIPMKVYNGVPTDFLYTDVDEPITGTGDIAVGRIPAYYAPGVPPGSAPFNMAQIDEILVRTLMYCLSSGASAEWRRLAMLPIVPIGFDGDNYSTFAENVIIPKIKSNASGWEFCRLYDPFDYNFDLAFLNGVSTMTALPEAPYCNFFNVPEQWNNRHPGLVVFNTHGSQSHGRFVLGVDDLGYDFDGSGNMILHPGSVMHLSPTYPAVVFGASCSTAPSDFAFVQNSVSGTIVQHLAYQTLVNNAVAYIGSSRSITQDNNKSVAQGFVDYMTRKGLNCSVGEALNNAKSGTGDGTMMFNLWGCPNVSFNLTDFASTLSAPANFKSVPYTSGTPKTQIRLTWNAVTGASTYCIERADVGMPARDGFVTLSSTSSTGYTDANLPVGTKYRYRVFAQSSAGRGPYSIIDSATTYNASNLPGQPNTPAGLTVQTGLDCGTKLSWTPSSTGPAATSFNVKRAMTNTAASFVTIANVSSPMFSDTNLINGTTYWYRVSAVNDAGQSGVTAAVSVLPNSPGDGNVWPPTSFQAGSPAAPQNVSDVWFTWTNSYSALNYIGSLIEYMERMPDGSYASSSGANQWSKVCTGDRAEADPNVAKTYCTSWSTHGDFWIHARGNVQYRFRIRNFTHPGSDKLAFHYSSALTQDVTLPGDESKLNSAAPVFVPSSCYQDNPESILLTWRYYPTDPDYTGYTIYYKIGSGSWMSVTTPNSTYSYSVSVGYGKTVVFYVRANYSKDNVLIDGPYSSSITLSTNNQPVAPSYLQANKICGNKIDLYWNNNSLNNPGPTFSIDRKVGTGSWVVNAYTTGAGATQYANTGLTPNTQYSYRIRAVYNGTYSSYSETITVMTYNATAQSSTSGYDANKAVDSDPNTQWLASSTTRPQWWQVNLNALKDIWGINIKWTTAAAWKYRIDGSTNGTTWTTIVDQRTRTSTSQFTSDYFKVNSQWKYLKVTVTGGPSGVKAGMYDFTIF